MSQAEIKQFAIYLETLEIEIEIHYLKRNGIFGEYYIFPSSVSFICQMSNPSNFILGNLQQN